MNELWRRLQAMPRATQAAVAVAAAVVVVGGIALFGSPKAIAAFVAGLAVIGLVLVVYEHLAARARSRGLAPLEQAIRGNASSPLVAISEPARRARLDDLRRSFESGLQKFRDAGKNLYALPWYLVVGEPGSGKTEAIRHCNVGFPPGLQDQLQGAGGTLNMNWWFTNHAVLLDTAGRLMFEEVEPGATGEWQEFLRLLRRSRPSCPINGMLLVIPAESLVRDSADAIERKGARIAQQLDQIQRALGVRFPVYVVVTKCDLINGFREFFDGITDPSLQHQMFGWSNPAPLDTPFNPELIDQHLQSVRRRLVRRRLGLLLDPVNTEDPRQSRTAQVDALYEFPDAFQDIAPRLKRYLSMIFVAGEWSARPLFLRGIYFTSSMREGEALDAKLAEALGVPVESLPEGRVWERDRSYFLRDLFVSKVFRERGLVTRAANTRRQQFARRGLVFGVAGLGLVALGAFSLLGHRSMTRTMLGPSEFWRELASSARSGREPADTVTGLSARTLPIIAPNARGSAEFFYRGRPASGSDPLLAGLPVAEERRTRAGIHSEVRARIEERLPAPWVYAPVALLGGEGDRDIARDARARAGRALFESGVLRAALDAARVRLNADIAEKRPWSGVTTDAFIQLLRAHSASISGRGDLPSLDPLVRLALSANDDPALTLAAADLPELDALAKWYFLPSSGDPVPPSGLPRLSGAELRAAGAALVDSLDNPPPQSGLAAVTALVKALAAFDQAEQALVTIDPAKPAPDWVSDWRARTADIAEARRKIDSAIGVLDNRSLSRAYADELTAYRERRATEVNRLLGELDAAIGRAASSSEPAVAALRELRETIDAGRQRLTTATKDQADLVLSLARLDASFIGDPGRPYYLARQALYERINARFDPATAQPPESEPAAALAAIESDLAADRRIIDEELRERLGATREGLDANARASAARAVATRAATLAADARRAAIVARLGERLPASADEIAAAVARSAAGAPPPPRVPMLLILPTLDQPEFDPAAAARILAEFAAVRRSLPQQRTSSAAAAASDYSARYLAHWTAGLARHVQVPPQPSYQQLRRDLALVGSHTVLLEALGAVQARAEQAVERIAPLIDTADAAGSSSLASARRLLAKSRTALDSPEFAQLCSGVLSRWRALPDDADRARESIAATALGPAPLEPYFIRAADEDFVRRSCQALTVSWLRTLAAPTAQPSPSAPPAADPSRFDRFPLGRLRPGVRALSPAEVAEARAALVGTLTQGSAQRSPACDHPISDDPDINQAARALLGCGTSGADSPAAAAARLADGGARMRRMLEALTVEASRSECRVSILTDRPARPGSRPMTTASHLSMFIAAGGGGGGGGGPPRGRTVPVRAGETLGAIPLVAESALFEPRTGSSGERSAGPPFTVDGPWIPLRLIEEFGGAPVGGDARLWEVEVVFSSGGTTYSMWLRLAFDFPLPAIPW